LFSCLSNAAAGLFFAAFCAPPLLGRLQTPASRWLESTSASSSSDSSFFHFLFLFMNELAKAVIALVLSTAAAVWLLGVALQSVARAQISWPTATPCRTSRSNSTDPVNAVRFWVEDFGGLQYERVWLYVNGRLAVVGRPRHRRRGEVRRRGGRRG
jgi:hypothetical protein